MSKTLEQCKDEIAKRYGYSDWSKTDFYQIDALNETRAHEDGAEKFMLNQAAELYAESAIIDYRDRLKAEINLFQILSETFRGAVFAIIDSVPFKTRPNKIDTTP